MKKLFRHLFVPCLALTLTFSFASCKKKGCIDSTADNYDAAAKKDDGSCTYTTPTPTLTPTPISNYCNYTVDGVSVTSGAFFLTNNFSSYQFQSYPVSAGSFPDMVIYITDTVTAGTYPSGGQFDFNYQFHYLTGSTQNDSYYGNGTSGSITVTSHDTFNKNIEGTFNGTLSNASTGVSVSITNGSFGFSY